MIVTTQEYYGTGSGTDLDPLQLKMLNISLDRADPENDLATDFTSGSMLNISDFYGIGYYVPGLDTVQTTALVSDVLPYDDPNNYEDTDYQDVTGFAADDKPCNCVSAPCNCTDKKEVAKLDGDKPDMMSAEYWKALMSQQAKNSRVWGMGIFLIFVYLAYRAGKNG